MKTFKFYTFLLVLIPMILLGCANNSGGDDPEPPGPPGEPVDLTKANLIGTWEIGYFTKKVGATSPQRDAGMDGFLIEFKNDDTYIEKNSLGEDKKGTFSIVDDKHVKLTFKVEEDGKETESSTTLKIMKLTNKVMYRENTYTLKDKNGVSYNVVDVHYLRNVATAPDETFGFTKNKTVTANYIKEEWTLTEIGLFFSTDGINFEKVKDYDQTAFRGNTLRFTPSTNDPNRGGFVERTKNGTGPEEKGEFVIVDDIIHFYYSSAGKDGEVSGKMMPMRVIILSETNNYYKFEHYTQQIIFLGSNKFEIQEIRTIFSKAK